MKILTGNDIRRADLYTIEHGPVESLALMERAAEALTREIIARCEPGGCSGPDGCCGRRKPGCCGTAGNSGPEYLIVAGKGNNAGDGLAVARLLHERLGSSRKVSVLLSFPEDEMSPDCRSNLERLPAGVAKFSPAAGRMVSDGIIHDGSGPVCPETPYCPDVRSCPGSFSSPESLFTPETVVIDAVLGSGVCGEPRGRAADAIRLINSNATRCRDVISIDLPSGLPTEPSDGWKGDPDSSLRDGTARCAVAASCTLTIEFPKLSLLLPETGRYAGRLEVVHIGLDRGFIASCRSCYATVDRETVRSLLLPRNEYGHKGSFGHAMIIAGCKEMIGAAVLCTGGALRSGCGLVTAHVPSGERLAVQLSHPSAIVSCDPSSAMFSAVPDCISKYSSIAVGPGLGRAPETVRALGDLFSRLRDMREAGAAPTLILDADALNIISSGPQMLGLVPPGSVLTPHIGELSRLLRAALASGMIPSLTDADTGTDRYPWADDMQKVVLVKSLAAALKSVIVVKGAHTMTCSPQGDCHFNMSGNPGMAKGGSGDVLAGLIAGLAARGYSPLHAALLGVWFHGLAGDRAAGIHGQESMCSADLPASLKVD